MFPPTPPVAAALGSYGVPFVGLSLFYIFLLLPLNHLNLSLVLQMGFPQTQNSHSLEVQVPNLDSSLNP